MACCRSVKLLRFWLLVQNLVLFAGALALLTVSVDALSSEHPHLESVLGVSVSRGAALLLTAVATLVLVVSFLGCCGAMLQNTCLLGLFGCFSVLLFILTVAGFASALVAAGPEADVVQRDLFESMGRYGNDTEVTAVWDFLQRDFQCCGVRGGADWSNHSSIDTEVPASCCRPGANGTQLACEQQPTDRNSYYEHGCFSSAQQLLEDHSAALAGATAAVAIFLVLSCTLSCFYIKMKR
ncbi:CD63 antigen [Amphibalanus amphitrite]|uniref:Tetraspanin n=1 Tax=Amphibalanus amphitrite TaxID=1232801 RepID=A0A6A4VF80_AMPAM|nr:CD63 antigen-like [Amphibalanus amphitrite]KAF0292565.1 CD63 antigen [Amphibalanus amphitrite]